MSVTTSSPSFSNPPHGATGSRPKLVFVVTEDWFFASHFLPMARAAVEAGFEPVVVTRLRDHLGVIEATGARLVPLDLERRANGPASLMQAVRRLGAILEAERPALIHAIALRSILIAGLAGRMAGNPPSVQAVTGLGFLGARRDLKGRLARALLGRALAGPLSPKTTRFLLENPEDARFLRLSPYDKRIRIVGGAGVDPQAYPPAPLPSGRSLRLALVSRMVWSKGVDTAVEAVTMTRAKGVDVTLTIFGAPDGANPRAIPTATLEEWNGREGIVWAGPTRDIPAVWAAHHAAIFPSRGGEGLPRTLLEAAACGRAILTSDVPGCRDLVRDGIEGYVLAPDDASAFSRAIEKLAAEPETVAAMGKAARERILAGYTERHVMETVKALWRELL